MLVVKTSGSRYMFHVARNARIPTEDATGTEMGSMMRKKMPPCPIPSSRPASSSSLGTVMKNCRNINADSAPCEQKTGRNISGSRLSVKCHAFI